MKRHARLLSAAAAAMGFAAVGIAALLLSSPPLSADAGWDAAGQAGRSCREVVYDASLGTTPEQQGWTAFSGAGASASLREEGGQRYLKITDAARNASVAFRQSLFPSDIQDRDWTYEGILRVHSSNYDPDTVGVNMLLASDGSRSSSLYFHADRYGVLGTRAATLRYARVVPQDTRNRFRHYKLVYHRNGPGPDDDTLDVTQDDQIVVQGVRRDEFYAPRPNETGSNGDAVVLFGVASTYGIGEFDVAYVRYATGDCDGGSSSSAPAADLFVTKSGPAAVTRGSTVTYTLAVTNSGPAAAQNVVVSDPVPGGLSYLSSTLSSCAQQGPAVVCPLGTLTPGTTTFTVTFYAPAAQHCSVTTVLNTAAVSADNDPNPANNTSQTVATTLNCPVLPPQCSDGLDNDGDGLADARDPGCHADGNANNPGSYDPQDDDETDPVGLTGCIQVIKRAYDSAGSPVSPVEPFDFWLDGNQGVTVTTDGSGIAVFQNVPAPGLHQVHEVPKDGWTLVSQQPEDGVVFVNPGSSCAAVAFQNRQTAAPVLPQCSDGVDNDGDGRIDFPSDPGCDGAQDDDEFNSPSPPPPPPPPQCSDGRDNDGDGRTDFPADLGCDDTHDNDESSDTGYLLCADGKDNDGDGMTDLQDPGCAGPSDDDEANAAVSSYVAKPQAQAQHQQTLGTQPQPNMGQTQPQVQVPTQVQTQVQPQIQPHGLAQAQTPGQQPRSHAPVPTQTQPQAQAFQQDAATQPQPYPVQSQGYGQAQTHVPDQVPPQTQTPGQVQAQAPRQQAQPYPPAQTQPQPQPHTQAPTIQQPVATAAGPVGAAVDLDANSIDGRAATAMVSANVMPVYGDNSFHGAWLITRGDLALILARATGVQPPADIGDWRFADAPHMPEYDPAVMEAVRRGLLVPYPDNTIRPEYAVTRSDLLAAVLRLLGHAPSEAGIHALHQQIGIFPGPLNPHQPVTRYDIARALYVIAGGH